MPRQSTEDELAYGSRSELRALFAKHGVECPEELLADLLEYVRDCAQEAGDDANEAASYAWERE
jgi:hypothetical protein